MYIIKLPRFMPVHYLFSFSTESFQSATVTRKNVAGIDVEFLRVLLF